MMGLCPDAHSLASGFILRLDGPRFAIGVAQRSGISNDVANSTVVKYQILFKVSNFNAA